MMYRKAKLFADSTAMNQVLESIEPGKAKAIGRTVGGFDQAIWEEHRMEIAVSGNVAKFCLLYTSPSPRDRQKSRMPSSA